MKKVRKYGYQKRSRAQPSDKVKMRFELPPEMLGEEGKNLNKPVPVNVEIETPKGMLTKKEDK